MNALVLVVIGVAMMLAGYFIYSKLLGRKIFQLSDRYKTPAHTMKDGVDYVPTNKYVLWGHHFTSVAGAAPIVGPAVAVIWGWFLVSSKAYERANQSTPPREAHRITRDVRCGTGQSGHPDAVARVDLVTGEDTAAKHHPLRPPRFSRWMAGTRQHQLPGVIPAE